MQIFVPKRSLNPYKSAGKITLPTSKPSKVGNFKIIINIIRATGIPSRNQEPTILLSAGRRNSEISSAISSK